MFDSFCRGSAPNFGKSNNLQNGNSYQNTINNDQFYNATKKGSDSLASTGLLHSQDPNKSELERINIGHFDWDALLNYNKSKIFNGLNAVAQCQNNRCISYGKWTIHNLGTGKFDTNNLHEHIFCDVCPYRDSVRKPLKVSGLFFKECMMKILKIDFKNSWKMSFSYSDKYQGKSIKFNGIERHEITDSLFDKGGGRYVLFQVSALSQVPHRLCATDEGFYGTKRHYDI